jgi:formylmethanofuran dehydrogenase subunit E
MTILGTWKQCFIMEENTPIDAPLICSSCGAITERNYNDQNNVLCMYCFYDLPETI